MRSFLAFHQEISSESDQESYRQVVASNRYVSMVVAGSVLTALVFALVGWFGDHSGVGGMILFGILSAITASMGKSLQPDETRLRELSTG